MSFYIVPSVSFQTQQKLKNSKKHESEKERHKRKKKASERKSSSKSGSSPNSSTNNSIRTASIHEVSLEEKEQSPFNRNDNKELDLKQSPSSGSLRPPHSVDGSSSQSSPSSQSPTQSNMELNRSANGDPLEPLTTYMEVRRNSTSTTSSFPRHKYRRNSSLSSAHTGSSISIKDGPRPKLSTNLSGSPLNTSSIASSKDIETDKSMGPRLFKPSYSMTPTESFPEFHTIKDLTVLNSSQRMLTNIYSPSFQIFRYNNFLDIISSQHINDPVNFANIRYNSISKFLLRHSTFSNIPTYEVFSGNDIRDFEGALAYNLLEMRTFLRSLIRNHYSRDNIRNEIFSCEELVQINFTNYIRYLLNLPQKLLSTPTENLDEILVMHQKFKRMLVQVTKALNNFKREDTGDDIINTTNSTASLLQLITKVSYDYILLEKYHINILTKFSNNSLLDARLSARMFDIYKSSQVLPSNQRTIPKVLLYNSYFSSQYSWYFATTIPFVTVVEASVFNENPTHIENIEHYQRNEKSTPKHSFDKLDIPTKRYFEQLNFDSFTHYRSYTDSQLVDLVRTQDDASSITSDNSNTSSLHKPRNFNFYSDSLSTIETEHFDIIQCRDVLFQLTNSNHRTILSEFHRVLKVGGTLDIPVILLGADTIKPNSLVTNFPRFTNTRGLDLSQYYDIIPNFAEVLLTLLIELFGEGNVKFSTVLLNSSTEITKFLAQDIGLHIAEIIGKTNDFCKNFEANLGKESTDIHFFFHIQAQKV